MVVQVRSAAGYSQKERAMDMFFAYPFSIEIIAALLAAVIVIFGGTRWAFAGPALADGRPRAAPVSPGGNQTTSPVGFPQLDRPSRWPPAVTIRV
jgi:hypothetical protein